MLRYIFYLLTDEAMVALYFFLAVVKRNLHTLCAR